MEFNSCELQELNIFHYFSKKDHVQNALLMLVDTVLYVMSFFLTILVTMFEWSNHSALAWHDTWVLLVIINCSGHFLKYLASQSQFFRGGKRIPKHHVPLETSGASLTHFGETVFTYVKSCVCGFSQIFVITRRSFSPVFPDQIMSDLYKNTFYSPLASAFSWN